MSGPMLEKMCPFFIVSNIDLSVAFYCDKLGFERWYQQPESESFFAIVGRDEAMLFLKSNKAEPLPNVKRDPWIAWDTYILVKDPDALASEFAARGVTFNKPVTNTHEGLRGFEIADPDGYVLFFGRPG